MARPEDHVRSILGDLLLQLAILRSENDDLKEQLAKRTQVDQNTPKETLP